MNKLRRILRTNPVAQILGGTLAIVGIILLAVAGVGVVGSIFLIALIGLTIYFGSIRELAGSALIAVLLKTMGGTIKLFVTIWLSAQWVEPFFALVNATDYINLILTFFFFFYLLSFATGSVKLFHFTNSVTNSQKQED